MQMLDTSFISGRDRRPDMSLDSFKWLVSDRWSAYGTYPPILTTRILRALRCRTMALGGLGAGVHNVTSDARNEIAGVRGMMNSRNGCICVCRKFLLEAEG